MTYSNEPAMAPADLLTGQVIAVTGAESGYGRLMSTALARAGANVILVGEQPEALSVVATAIERAGSMVIPLKANVGVPLDWRGVQDRIMDIFGILHGVVHVADRRSYTPFTSMSENEWMEMFSYNVKSSVAIAQMTSRRRLDSWLTIIGPHLDDHSLQSHPQRGALRGLVEQAHLENLRINMVLPSRECSGDLTLDQPMVRSILMMADPNMSHIRGNIIAIQLPPLPQDALGSAESAAHERDFPYELLQGAKL